MAKLQIENLPDELYSQIECLASEKKFTLNEAVIHLLTQSLLIDTNICIKLFVADLLTSKVNQLFTHLDDPSVEFFVPDLFYIDRIEIDLIMNP